MLTILGLLNLLLRALEFIIVIWVLMSWLPGAQHSSFGQLLGRVSGLILNTLRRFIPTTGIIDLTPLVGLILLQAAEMGLQAIARTMI